MAAFDYKDPGCVRKIKDFINPSSGIQYIWDTISEGGSPEICAQVINPGGTYGYLLHGTKFPRADVKTTFSLGYLAIGERIKKNDWEIPAAPEDFEFVKDWVVLIEPLLQQELIKAHPPQIGHGLEGVLDGLELMRNGRVSGKKLVYVL